jgi:erythronate-4-phosphate dehydrogenase
VSVPHHLKIVADGKIPFLRSVLEPFATVEYRDGSSMAAEDLRDADALIVRTRTVCGRALLADSAVRFIASATIGHEHIDAAFCAARGIVWTNAAGCNAASVQQYVGSALAALRIARGLPLAGRTLGVVGVGHVGSRIVTLGTALGMRVLQNDPPRARREGSDGFVSLDQLLDDSDVITLHVPLDRDGADATFHLIGAAGVARLRPEQVLINTARGEVVDTTALTHRLMEGALAGCVLDVWEREPDIDAALLAQVAVATPHIAGYSVDGKANGTAMAVQALSRFFGLPLHEWSPPLPAPPRTLDIDAEGRSSVDVICDLMSSTYDIRADDSRLRASPDTFEAQRAEHPPRRDWAAHVVALRNASPEVAAAVASLGFSLRPVT